jgi:hypothetical protein
MRFQFLALICLSSLFVFAKGAPHPILVSHNEIKGPIVGNSHTEDLMIFGDGSVTYKEAGNDRKEASFAMKLTAQKLQRLTLLLHGKEMRAVPTEIPSQIRTIDYNWEKKMEIYRNGSQQTVVIRNFYPLLNSHRPAYPKALIELECMLQDIQRRAAKRPAPTGEENWCPEALGKTR